MNIATDDAENANELQFGKELFKNDENYCLTNDALYQILLTKQTTGADTLDNTFAYLERVVTTKSKAECAALNIELAEKLTDLKLERRTDYKAMKLHPYEIASLSNLVKDEDCTVEEIVSLIPSLSRFPDDQVDIALNIVVEAKEKVSGGL